MNLLKHAAAAVFLCATAVAQSPAAEVGAVGPVEALKFATEAYIYGYPLATFDMARRQQTNVAQPDAEHAPMGQMIRMRTYPAVDNHCCAAPNADTLYTEAWLDVSKEPVVFSIPDMRNRYYIMPMLDGWSEVIFVAGSGTTGGKPQTYVITGPGWNGSLPPGTKQVKSPTGMVWILGRIYSTGTPEDYKAVHALQDQYSAAQGGERNSAEVAGLRAVHSRAEDQRLQGGSAICRRQGQRNSRLAKIRLAACAGAAEPSGNANPIAKGSGIFESSLAHWDTTGTRPSLPTEPG